MLVSANKVRDSSAPIGARMCGPLSFRNTISRSRDSGAMRAGSTLPAAASQSVWRTNWVMPGSRSRSSVSPSGSAQYSFSRSAGLKGAPGGGGTSAYAATLNAGAPFTSVRPWWDSLDNLKKYDIVLHSCEGGERAAGEAAVRA